MAHENIIALLVAERDRLTQAIEVLQGGTSGKRRGRPRKTADDPTMPDWVKTAPKKRKGRKYTAAQRKAQSIATKARWAAIKAAAGKAKGKKKAKAPAEAK